MNVYTVPISPNINTVPLNPIVYVPEKATNFLSTAHPSKTFPSSSIQQAKRSWGYLEKMIVITRLLLTAAARNFMIVSFVGRCFPQKIEKMTTEMKLFSAISLPFNMANLSEAVQNYFHSFQLRDQEGLAFETISLARGVATAYDNLNAFVNALILLSRSSLKLMPTISTPINLLLTTLGTATIYSKLEKTSELHKALNQDLNSKNKEEYLSTLREVLKRYVAIEKPKLKNANNLFLSDLLELKKIELLRFVPKEALPELKKLLDLIDQRIEEKPISDASFEKIMPHLKKILGELEKRMKLDTISLFAHLFFITAFMLFLAGYAAALPFVLISSGLGMLVWHDVLEIEE